MNLSLLVNVEYYIILFDLILGLIIMYMIINKEYIAHHRRQVFHLATFMWVLIFLVYILYTVIMHYIPAEPYSTIVKVQGENITIHYNPSVGLPNISILKAIIILMIVGVAVLIGYDDVIYQLDMERCEKGEA